jgi:hypothetical protein
LICSTSVKSTLPENDEKKRVSVVGTKIPPE